MLMLCTLLAACSGDGDDSYRFAADAELAVSITDGVLSAVVPAEGGLIVGPVDSAFEGVAIDLPAGALPAGTTVTIAPGTESDPLPELAERVGAQFTFGPADPPLAAPAAVTLPVRTEALDQLASGAEAVRVWVREGDAWSLQEAVTSTESAVTLEVDTLSTAAAGVKSVAFSIPRCLTCAPTCPSSGACVENLGTLPVPPSTASFSGYRFAADATGLAYVGSQNGADVGVRLALPAVGSATGALAATVSQPAVGGSACCLTPPLLDEDGSLRVARTFEGAGFTRFRFGQPTQLEATTVPGRPIGLVRTRDGVVARVTRNGAVAANGSFASFPLIRRIDSFAHLATDFGFGDSFIAISNTAYTRLRRYDLAGDSNDGTDTPGLQSCQSMLRSDFQLGTTALACLSRRATASGPVQSVVRCDFRFGANDSCARAFESPQLSFFDLDYDADGGVWLSSVNTAEVLYLSPAGVLTSHNLQTALPNLDLSQLLPRDVVTLDDTTALVVTSANRVIRVRRE